MLVASSYIFQFIIKTSPASLRIPFSLQHLTPHGTASTTLLAPTPLYSILPHRPHNTLTLLHPTPSP